MILKKKTPDPLPKLLRAVLYAAMLLAILVTPALVAKASDDVEKNAEWVHQQEMLAIEQQEIKLQKEMRLLENERMRVQLDLEEKMQQRQLKEMQQEVAALEQAGQQAEAEELRRRIVTIEWETTLHREEVEAAQIHAEKRMQLEFELQDLMLQRQTAEATSDLKRAQELMQQMFVLEQSLRRLELEAMQADLDRQHLRFEREKQELQELEP